VAKASAPADAPTSKGTALVRISHGVAKFEDGKPVLNGNGLHDAERIVIEPGAALPPGFDPEREGLERGVHWQ
jgi:hypothetical protein